MVKQQVKIPIIAAGGIASGRGMLAAMVLGADAVQLEVGLLLQKNLLLIKTLKTTIINAKDGDTH